MKPIRLPSLVLALALQVLPVARVFLPATQSCSSGFAIVSTWIAGLGALLGSYNAVSGASTTITSPTTAVATNGTVFSYRITTAPDAANWFAASNLPAGLTLSTTVGRISGTPTTNGIFVVRLTASDNQRPDRTITANLTLTVKPQGGGLPVIATQPRSSRIAEGAGLRVEVMATGPEPLRYLWRKNGATMVGATNASFTVAAALTNDAGIYSVVVVSPYGSVLSSNAPVSVVPLPRFSRYSTHNGQLDLSFVREAGAAYDLEFKDATTGSGWQQWTNWPASASSSVTTVSASSAASVARLYHIKMTLP